MNGFTLGDLSVGTDALNVQYTCDNLGEVTRAICEQYGLGYDITIDLDNRRMVFSLYAGEDRSYFQDVNPYVVFSPQYENLVSTTYQESTRKFFNVANVGGEGEGDERKFATAGDTAMTGLDRYELYVDKRNVSSNNGEIPEEEYLELLATAGEDKLAGCQVTQAFEGSVQSLGNFNIGIDFDLGDIVEVVNEFGIEGRSRITAIIDCLDGTGRHIVPTFESVRTEVEYWADEEGNIFSDELGNRFIFK